MNKLSIFKIHQKLLNKLPGLLKILPARKMSKALSFVSAHKIGLVILFVAVAFIAGSLEVRQTLIKSLLVAKQAVPFNNYLPLPTPIPTITDSPPPSDSPVLGVSSETSAYTPPYAPPTPLPTDTPVPTPIPTPIPTPTPSNTSQSATFTNSNPSSGNPNCTTGSGIPNFWYSEFSPSSPVSAGSTITISVAIKDCFKNPVGSDELHISLNSGDSSTQINGKSLSSFVSITTQNGQASFTITSQNTTTDSFTITDVTNNFSVTDANNHPLTVNFNSSGSTNSSCTPDKDAYYSNIYFPSGSIAVGSNATIIISLRDCNNQTTLNSDTITVTPKSVDSSFQFVGYGSGAFTLPNGQSSFQVTSQNPGTNTFIIRDTTQGFDITGPHYSTPSVTFANSSPTPIPTSTPTPSSSPTDGPSSSPTPSPTPTPSPLPSPTPTANPSPSVSPIPSPSP